MMGLDALLKQVQGLGGPGGFAGALGSLKDVGGFASMLGGGGADSPSSWGTTITPEREPRWSGRRFQEKSVEPRGDEAADVGHERGRVTDGTNCAPDVAARRRRAAVADGHGGHEGSSIGRPFPIHGADARWPNANARSNAGFAHDAPADLRRLRWTIPTASTVRARLGAMSGVPGLSRGLRRRPWLQRCHQAKPQQRGCPTS